MSVFLLIFGLILFVGLIVVHEFGHFIVARRNGVDVEEFGIGFPPRIWGRKTKSKFIFSINWLPLGGFVKLKGEHDSDTAPGSFGAATTWVKTKIMLAGVTMNLLAAFAILTVLAAIGMPQIVNNQFNVAKATHTYKNEVLVGLVESGSPAQKAGIKVRDELEEIGPANNLQQISSANQLPSLTEKYAGQTVEVEYLRNGVSFTSKVTLQTKAAVNEEIKKTGTSKGYLGVAPTEYTLIRSSWYAPVVALGLMKQFTVLTFQGLGTAISALAHGNTSKASAQVSGPVGIFVLLKDGSLLGYQFVLLIVAVISLTLALMNILPIPALDGGRLFMLLVSRLVRKPLSQKLEERITGLGFAFLLFLIALITVSDVKHHL